MGPIEVVLFDWGGTLAQVVEQSDRLRAGARRAALRLTGCECPEVDAFVEGVLGAEAQAAAHPELREADLGERLRDWCAAAGLRADERAREDALKRLCEAWVGSLHVLPGAVETLAELRRRGYRMGLVSNCMMPPETSRRELDRLGLGAYLDFAVFSSGVGYRKPSNKIYKEAIALARRDENHLELSRVLFVGDSPEFDVIAPARLGMKTALVTCYRGLWPAEAYERARPDVRIDSVSELPLHLK